MSEKKLNKELSSIIHEYFDSDPHTLTKTKVLNIYNDPKININFENITKEQSKKLIGIVSLLRKNPEIKFKLHKKKKSEKIEEIIEKETDDKKDLIKYKDFKGEKYVSFQRKAFIDFNTSSDAKKAIDIISNMRMSYCIIHAELAKPRPKT